ncbi:MAG: type I 3-dehydroquinate dehydratase [Brachybacterium sp.]|nr:type I 3-dehydroquinate dehydratase [Brachybacterium sp.]
MTSQPRPGLTVHGTRIGAGTPPVAIVPLVAASVEQLLDAARTALDAGAELLEWRIDHLETGMPDGPERTATVVETAQHLRGIAGDVPLLATVRTAAEGGERPIPDKDYGELLTALAQLGPQRGADLLDVEICRDTDLVAEVIAAAHAAGVAVVGSHHRFDATPGEAEMVAMLQRIAAAGPDLAKLAVMPRDEADVLALLRATHQAAAEVEVPVLTMSMGPLGAISRLAGTVTGSVGTFAVVGEPSAPGQLPLDLVVRWRDLTA